MQPDSKSNGLIYLIDIERESAELLANYLHSAGYRTRTVQDQDGGITELQNESCDIVLIAVRVTDPMRFEPIRRIRSFTTIPILVVGAGDDKIENSIAMELGADDVLSDPIIPREVLAKIRAIKRRITFSLQQIEALERSAIKSYGDITLNFDTYTTLLADQKVKLTTLEFSLLKELLRSSGKVLSRQELATKVLNRELSPFDRSIDVHVSSLRRKLGKHLDGEERIKSIRGIGYLYTHKAEHLK